MKKHYTRNAKPIVPWSRDQAIGASVNLPPDPTEHWKSIVNLFPARELIWIGPQNGFDNEPSYFWKKDKWVLRREPPGDHVFPCTFDTRTSLNPYSVCSRPFFVVQIDGYPTDETLGILRWLAKRCGLSLRCIIEKETAPTLSHPTGLTKYQAWYDSDRPGWDRYVNDLTSIVPADSILIAPLDGGKPPRKAFLPCGELNGSVSQIIYLNKPKSI